MTTVATKELYIGRKIDLGPLFNAIEGFRKGLAGARLGMFSGEVIQLIATVPDETDSHAAVDRVIADSTVAVLARAVALWPPIFEDDLMHGFGVVQLKGIRQLHTERVRVTNMLQSDVPDIAIRRSMKLEGARAPGLYATFASIVVDNADMFQDSLGRAITAGNECVTPDYPIAVGPLQILD